MISEGGIVEYRQVLLFRDAERQVCWVPAGFANVGCVLKLKEGNAWDDGWVVSQVYGSQSSERLESDKLTAISDGFAT